MGLLFNPQHHKRIADNTIDKKDILALSKKLSLYTYGARAEFESLMNRAQSGGITREEVLSLLEKMILDGKITEEKAKDVARILGVDNYLIKKLKDISESRKPGTNAPTTSSPQGSDKSREAEERTSEIAHSNFPHDNSRIIKSEPSLNIGKPAGNFSASPKPPSRIWSVLKRSSKQ